MQSDTTVRISKTDRNRIEDIREEIRENTGEKPTVKQIVSEAIDIIETYAPTESPEAIKDWMEDEQDRITTEGGDSGGDS